MNLKGLYFYLSDLVTRKWVLIALTVIASILFWKGYEISLWKYPSPVDANAATDLRYNIYAVIISIAVGLSIPGKTGLLRILISTLFWLAVLDLPFRYFGINWRQNSDNIQVLVSFGLAIAAHYIKPKTNDV